MPWAPGVAPGALAAEITLTPAQILALFTTPVTLLPAPGPGLSILVVDLAVVYKFGGVAYVDHGSNLSVNVGGSLGWQQTPTVGFWDQATDQIWQTGLNIGKSASGAFAGPLTINATVANPTGGNGTLKVNLLYQVVQI